MVQLKVILFFSVLFNNSNELQELVEAVVSIYVYKITTSKGMLTGTIYVHNHITVFGVWLMAVKAFSPLSWPLWPHKKQKSWNYSPRFKIVFKLSSVLIDLFHNNNYGRKQQVAKEEAFIGTSEEMIDLMENESRGIP